MTKLIKKTKTEKCIFKNMKRVSVVLLIIIFSGLTSNCWKKQKHEITAPKTPVYTVSGVTQDQDTHELLSSVKVVLTAVELTYEYDFKSATDTSNQDGNYEFIDITPGMYQIKTYRDGLPVYDEPLVVEHQDKVFDIDMPKPLVANQFYGPPNHRVFSGIHWKYSDVLAGVYYYYHKNASAIFLGNYTDDFEMIGRYDLVQTNPQFHGLAYLGSFWAAGGSEEDPKMYSIDPSKGNIDGITDLEYYLVDITSDSSSLWGTVAVGKIIQFGEHPSLVINSYNVDITNLGGIAWNGSNIWASDSLDGMIYRLDSDMSIAESYRSFFWDNASLEYKVLNLSYLAFDPNGNLWGGNGISVYEFKR